jgi:hypothetical protein
VALINCRKKEKAARKVYSSLVARTGKSRLQTAIQVKNLISSKMCIQTLGIHPASYSIDTGAL